MRPSWCSRKFLYPSSAYNKTLQIRARDELDQISPADVVFREEYQVKIFIIVFAASVSPVTRGDIGLHAQDGLDALFFAAL